MTYVLLFIKRSSLVINNMYSFFIKKKEIKLGWSNLKCSLNSSLTRNITLLYPLDN